MTGRDSSMSRATGSVRSLRVALLTNILLRHSVVVLEALQARLPHLRVFLSAVNEPDRKNPVHWGSLDVVVQKAFRRSFRFRNRDGYQDVTHLQIPYDTLQQLLSWKPEVVVSGQFGGRTLFATLYKILRPRTVFIVWATLSQRTEGTRGGVRLRLRQWILRHADACFTHGPDSEGYLRGLGFSKPVFHVPYVIPPGQFPAGYQPPADGCHTLLYTGQLIERKGILPFAEALLRWCSRHPEASVRFEIGGDGPQRAQLEALTAPPNLQLVLRGHMSPESIAESYRGCSFCVFPTLADEWGMVVNEALSVGVPILASIHAQSATQLIQDGISGWLFDPEQPASVEAGLDRAFAASRDELLRLSAAARNAVADQTPEVMAGRMTEAIAQLTSTYPGSYSQINPAFSGTTSVL